MNRHYSDFFASNEDRNELLRTLKQAMALRRPFLDPNDCYKHVKNDDTSMATVMENTFEPFESWAEITTNNSTLLPSLGSFVEYHDEVTDTVRFGVVVQEPYSKFNDHQNKMVVLTKDNELEKVYAPQISFAAYQVLDLEWVDSLDIMTCRFDEEYANRRLLVSILHQFASVVTEYRPWVSEQLHRVYARSASTHRVAGCSIQSVVDQFSHKAMESYFHQQALLIAVHLEMCNDVTRWIVSSTLPNRESNVTKSSSNSLPPTITYMANSVHNMEAICELLEYKDDNFRLFDEFLRGLIAKPPNYDDLTLRLNIWDGKPFKRVFDAMKFAIVYPHPALMSQFGKLSSVRLGSNAEEDTKKSVETSILPEAHSQLHRNLHAVLQSIHMYDNPRNPLTDIVLSAHLAGDPPLRQLAVASAKDLRPTDSELVSARTSNELHDNFPHLRNSKSYYQDHIIYTLPGDKGSSQLGVSLEKINARKYRVNIHVPDVVSRITPSSDIYGELTKTTAGLQHLYPLIDGDAVELLAKNVREELLLRSQSSKETFFSVGDLHAPKLSKSSQTCMTISFEYQTYDANPLELLDSVGVSFDSLHDVQIKSLDWSLLEDTLTGRLEPSLLRPFNLFSRTQKVQVVAMDEKDHFNVNFIYNVMKSHLKQRNRRGASVTPLLIKSGIFRSLSYDKTEQNNIITELHKDSTTSGRKKGLFFRRELEVFTGAMISAYCTRERIPALVSVQDTLDATPIKDEVYITHDNKLMPNFHGSSYHQTLLSRDSNGHVSLPAFFIANNYLAKPRTVVDSGPHVPMGLPCGYVNAIDAMSSVEAYLNQLQILAHCHAKQSFSEKYVDLVNRFSHLKGLGYPAHGALGAKFLQQQVQKLHDAKLTADFIVGRHQIYWALKMLQQRLACDDFETSCIITNMGYTLGDYRVARAYCTELGIEVDLIFGHDDGFTMGATARSKEVIYLDIVGGKCAMKADGPY